MVNSGPGKNTQSVHQCSVYIVRSYVQVQTPVELSFLYAYWYSASGPVDIYG